MKMMDVTDAQIESIALKLLEEQANKTAAALEKVLHLLAVAEQKSMRLVASKHKEKREGKWKN